MLNLSKQNGSPNCILKDKSNGSQASSIKNPAKAIRNWIFVSIFEANLTAIINQ